MTNFKSRWETALQVAMIIDILFIIMLTNIVPEILTYIITTLIDLWKIAGGGPVKEWQTLITGILALGAALITVHRMKKATMI